MEYKRYDTTVEVIVAHMAEADLGEEVLVTYNIKFPLPPTPPAAPGITEVVDHTDEIEETLIESTETTRNR